MTIWERAAVIGGAWRDNVRAGKLFDIPVPWDHAHALVQVYGDDYKAFKAYAEPSQLCLPEWIPMIHCVSEFRLRFRVAREMGDVSTSLSS